MVDFQASAPPLVLGGVRDRGSGFAEEDWGSGICSANPEPQIPNPESHLHCRRPLGASADVIWRLVRVPGEAGWYRVPDPWRRLLRKPGRLCRSVSPATPEYTWEPVPGCRRCC